MSVFNTTSLSLVVVLQLLITISRQGLTLVSFTRHSTHSLTNSLSTLIHDNGETSQNHQSYQLLNTPLQVVSHALHVRIHVDLVRQVRNLHRKALLHLLQLLLVLRAGHEGDSQTLGAESACAAHTVQILIR